MQLDQLPITPDLPALLRSLEQVAPLLDAMPDVVFFVKDLDARYVLVNQTLAQRCGFKDKAPLLGRTAEDVFPRRFGHLYTEQDRQVLEAGDQLTASWSCTSTPAASPAGA